jgi:Protein of unknown function (DUF3465)
MDLQSAYSGTHRAEVTFSARVASNARFFYGARTHCEHETFRVQTAAGQVEVIDNVGIAPRVPVQPGDSIRVRGELVPDRGRVPIVHWTHHDPRGRHAGGFIQLRGRVYA